MSSKTRLRQLLATARKLKGDLKWDCSQIWIGLVGFLFLGFCYSKGIRVDKNGQELFPFLVLWTLLFIYRVIATWWRNRRLAAVLAELNDVFNVPCDDTDSL